MDLCLGVEQTGPAGHSAQQPGKEWHWLILHCAAQMTLTGALGTAKTLKHKSHLATISVKTLFCHVKCPKIYVTQSLKRNAGWRTESDKYKPDYDSGIL